MVDLLSRHACDPSWRYLDHHTPAQAAEDLLTNVIDPHTHGGSGPMECLRYNPPMPPNRVVYDTNLGRTDRCSNCRRRLEGCVCPKQEQRSGADGAVRIWRDRKARRGKTVTVVAGFPGGAMALAEIATTLKRLCGSGGTVNNGNVEVQGDHRERLAAKLTELGFKVKRAGG